MTGNDRLDDEVRHLLRAERPLPSYSTEDWERLTRRIVAGSEPALSERVSRPRGPGRPRTIADRITVPLALAAGLAALVLLGRLETGASNPSATSAFLAAWAAEGSQETVLDATLGQTGETWLLAEGR